MKIIKQGAESVIYLDETNNKIIKDRLKKNYRIKEIDEKLRKFRTKREVNLLNKVKFAPKVYDFSDKNMKIEMEFINGKLIKNILDQINSEERKKICKKIGEQIAELHDKDIIHGDLTTSNMILKDDNVVFIDFGLGFVSKKYEDKAVDLHLLRQALESKHYQHYNECFESILEGYKKGKEFSEVMKRLERVEKRGRYKKK